MEKTRSVRSKTGGNIKIHQSDYKNDLILTKPLKKVNECTFFSVCRKRLIFLIFLSI